MPEWTKKELAQFLVRKQLEVIKADSRFGVCADCGTASVVRPFNEGEPKICFLCAMVRTAQSSLGLNREDARTLLAINSEVEHNIAAQYAESLGAVAVTRSEEDEESTAISDLNPELQDFFKGDTKH